MFSSSGIAVVDFETQAIGNRPEEYPPKPVGVAIREGGRSRYLAWGHPTGNNTTRAKALRELKKFWGKKRTLYHNGSFDLEVAQVHLGLPLPAWNEFEDTLLLSYLHDPRDQSLSLKPLAEKYLDLPPEEQDALKEWVLANVPEAKKSDWGAYIARAPGQLVGRYAKGDVDRTWRLFQYMAPLVLNDQRMAEAYDREREVIMVKLRMEKGGIRCNLRKLKREIKGFRTLHEELEAGIYDRLGVGEFNIGSGVQLAHALERADKVTHFIKTKTGKNSTKRENLEATCNDKELLNMLGMHGVLSTYLSTFLSPWLHRAEASDGYIYPSFNTVRSTDEYGGAGGVGTRTGRLSSSGPNFQNIPADIEGAKQEVLLRMLAKELKRHKVNFIGLRDFFIPDEGCVFLGRDYSQQEIRILAHFEDDILLRMYLRDPRIDIHQAIREIILDLLRMDLPRKAVKIVVFALIYGRGIANLALQLDTDERSATQIRNAVFQAIPGIKDLNKELRLMARNRQPIRTWGGRLYHCEEPKYINGQRRTFEYKMLNVLIQGSAADCTKEAMINVEQNWKHPESRIVLQVHDELLACVPKDHWKEEDRNMQEGMEDVEFAVPMLTDRKRSAVSWGRLR